MGKNRRNNPNAGIILAVLALWIGLLAPSVLWASLPTMVKDLNTTESDGQGSQPVVSNGIGYFAASDGTHGVELWRTDGTPSGTYLVKDLEPGECSSNPQGLTDVNGRLYFMATTQAAGLEPWVSDGTSAGTSMLADIYPGTNWSLSAPYVGQNVFVPMGGYVFFAASDATHGSELWRTDGTTAGTSMVKDINPASFGSSGSSGPDELTVVNGKLVFTAFTDALGRELYVSDGTSAGTSLVKDINPGTNYSYIYNLTAFNNRAFFSATDGVHGSELWASDGTGAGTSMVADINAGSSDSSPGGFTVFNSLLYFGVSSYPLHQFMSTDGTSAGTTVVHTTTGSMGKPVVFNGSLYYVDGGLWKSDGTTAGTVQISANGGSYLTAGANALFFKAPDSTLWKSDGTGAGTAQASPSYTFSVFSTIGPVSFGSGALFLGNDATHKNQVVVSDGTPGGTGLAADVSPGTQGSTLGAWMDYAGQLFFNASGGPLSGLWSTDGTNAGTQPVMGTTGSGYVQGNGYFFFVNGNGDLVGSDGTPGGTYVLDAHGALTGVGSLGDGLGGVFFSEISPGAGRELWFSDGTPGGTHLFKDLSPGSADSMPAGFKRIGSTVYFFTDDGTNGVKLWKSDGTPAGTVAVAVVAPSGNTNVGNLLSGGGKVFFEGWDATHGQQLWTTDGTSAGTSMVVNIPTGSLGPFTFGTPFVDFNGALYFTANTSANGLELWRSDGSSAGTSMVKDINPGTAGSGIFNMVASGGALYFNADDGIHGSELWRSDGTSAGTSMVKDINPGAYGATSNPANFIDAGGQLYFTANDGTTGTELWTSDGTSTGTTLADNVFCLGHGTNPVSLYYSAPLQALFMGSDDGIHGEELWKVNAVPAITPTPTWTPTPTPVGTRTPMPTPTTGPGGIAGNIVVDGIVQAVVDVPGTVYLGGQFTHAGPRTGQGVPISDTTGLLPGNFPRVAGGMVRSSVPDGNGGWYIGGNFTCVNGLPCLYLGHVLWDGSLDSTWKPGPDMAQGIYDLAISGNTLYVAGFFSTLGGQTRHSLAAFNTSTGDLLPWNPNTSNLDGSPNVILVSGGTVYVGGTFTKIGGNQVRNNAAAFNAATGALLPWNPNVDNMVTAMVLSGSNLYLGGSFGNVGGQPRSGLAAVDASTAALQAWNPGAGPFVTSLAVSGNSLVVGGTANLAGQPRNGLGAVDLTTGLATAWNPVLSGGVYCLASAGTTIYAGGTITGVGSAPVTARNYLAAWDLSTGNLLPWDPEADGLVYSLADSGGQIFAGGAFKSMNVVVRNHLCAVNAVTGALTSWNPNADAMVVALYPDTANGVMYVSGQFGFIGGVYMRGLAAVDLITGSDLSTWYPLPTGQVNSMVKLGNSIYVAGNFSFIGGVTRSNLAALTAYPATGTATGWAPACNGGVAVLGTYNNYIYAAGAFTSIGGQARNNLAQLDPGTGAAQAWNPNANGQVSGMTFNGNTLYVSSEDFTNITSSFTLIGGVARPGLAAVDATTGAILPWTPAAGTDAPMAYWNGGLYSGMMAYDTSTGAPLPWAPKPSYPVYGVVADAGKIFLGGYFTTLDCDTAEYFGSVLAYNVPNTPTWTATPTVTATWTLTPTITPTVTGTQSASSTPTPSPTFSATFTPTFTWTPTPSPTFTNTPTPTPTFTATSTYTPTPTPPPVVDNQAGPGETFIFPAPCTGDSAKIAYYMAHPGRAHIRVWNLAAQLSADLDDWKSQGPQESLLDLRSFKDGVFLYRVEMDYDGGGTERSKVIHFVVRR